MAKTDLHFYWQDTANVGLGLWMFVSTGFLNAMGSASWHRMAGIFMVPEGVNIAVIWSTAVVGIAVAILATFAAIAFRRWLEWVNMALGLWLFMSPWISNFHAFEALRWNAAATGLVISALAASVLTQERIKKHG